MSSARYRIVHDTKYRHAGMVSVSQHVACVRPRALGRQAVDGFELALDPAPADCVDRIDYFGNVLTQFSILKPYRELRVIARSFVEVRDAAPPREAEASLPWDAAASAQPPASIDDEQFRYSSAFVDASAEFAAY